MYGFLFIILLDLFFLFFAQQFFKIDDMVLYIACFIVFIFALWRLTTLKVFFLEVSDHIISVKYGNPLSQLRRPVLEVPLRKIVSLKTENGFMDDAILISIKSKRGIRNFQYRIGNLSSTEVEKFNKIKDIIKASSINEI